MFIILVAAIIVIAALMGLYMWNQANQNNLNELEIEFEDFPKEMKELNLFFISDIHRRIVSDDMINKVINKADLVIIGGDIVESGVPFEQVEANLKKLKNIAPLYFVWGNNDYEVDNQRLKTMFLNYNVKTLDNTWVDLRPESEEKCILLGVDSLTNNKDQLELALNHCPSGFKILASHDPRIINKIKKDHHISLVLSGHTHGGQIRFLGFGLYEKGGLSTYEQTKLFVSNGYGTSGVPLRLGAPAEVHLIKLKALA